MALVLPFIFKPLLIRIYFCSNYTTNRDISITTTSSTTVATFPTTMGPITYSSYNYHYDRLIELIISISYLQIFENALNILRQHQSSPGLCFHSSFTIPSCKFFFGEGHHPICSRQNCANANK